MAEGVKACCSINSRNHPLCFCRNLISADSDSGFSRSSSAVSSQREIRLNLGPVLFWSLRELQLFTVLVFTTTNSCCLTCNHGNLIHYEWHLFLIRWCVWCFYSQRTSSSTWPSWVMLYPSPPCSSLWPSSSTSGNTPSLASDTPTDFTSASEKCQV